MCRGQLSYNCEVKTNALYLHWPFCAYKCHFCPFIALASHDEYMNRYHNALCKEIEQFVSQSVIKQKIDTIFIGGGTPSTYPNELLLDMLGKLRSIFNINISSEITIEINPGRVREDQLYLWRHLGINRLSIGVQSLKDSVLKKLNRLQAADDVFKVMDQAERVFDNISVDLIIGLPEVSEHEWKDLLYKVVSWSLTHISIYFLTIHKSTPIYFALQSHKFTLPYDDDTLVDLYNWSVEFLAQYGFERYEISNFARSGYACKHNMVYWDRKPYKGFGLGACSFDGSSRFQNYKNLMDYLEGIEKCESVESFSELLTEEQVRLEKLMLGFRRSEGVCVTDLFEGLEFDRKIRLADRINELKKNNIIYEQDGRFVLSSFGFAVENEVVLKLL